MITIQGQYNTAICYTNELKERLGSRFKLFVTGLFAGCKIRIMPDVHAGKGCTIGTTMTIQDKIVPGMVGYWLWYETVELAEREIDFAKRCADSGEDSLRPRNPRYSPSSQFEIDLTQLRCADQVNLDRAVHSIGSLGGGNHFIEVDRRGRAVSRDHPGADISERKWPTIIKRRPPGLRGGARHQIQETIAQLKAEGRFQEIQKTITALKKEHVLDIPKDLAYVEGKLFDDYIHDMKLTQRFAVLNRKAMADIIVSGMGFTITDEFTTIHNYID
ncbi:MAG: RtcB family protein, partial [Hydrogeniiclostridium mannosilyticum]